MKELLSKAVLASQRILVDICRKFFHGLFAVIWTILWFSIAVKMAFERSYYPEKRRKQVFVRLFENILYVLLHHRANGFYTLYGMDVYGTGENDYIDENTFWKGLNKLNYEKGIVSQTCLLRDKYLFYKYMNANGMPVPEVFGFIENGSVYDNSFVEISYERIKNEKDYFIKDCNGECASFVKHIKDFRDLIEVMDVLKKGRYILQRRVVQSKEMTAINPKAINTLRVITVYNNGVPYVLAMLLRVGTKVSGNVDNWAAGGLAIGISENGYLKEYGFYKPGYGLKTNIHPDTETVFSEFKVPRLHEALEKACDAHRFFMTWGLLDGILQLRRLDRYSLKVMIILRLH